MPTMKRQDWHLTFLTPAFLGNAEQTAQWRTPPFKALLRQWWRVAWAAERGTDVRQMRREEGVLFGHAWLETDSTAARKSLVRLRLSRWDMGTQKDWRSLGSVTHPEVKQPVETSLYLGYGSLIYSKDKKGTTLKSNAAIQADEAATLSIAYPESEAERIETALNLMYHFGTLGGRSRNGWGSLHMESEIGAAITPPDKKFFKPWREALRCDWPHAIGTDDKGALIWHTQPFDDWRKVMEGLAHIKIALRTHFKFPNERGFHPAPEKRHWLSYPVTNHKVAPWERNNARLPNSLRFKVCRSADGKLFGKIFHVPCLPPHAFQPENHKDTITKVWESVHKFLDDEYKDKNGKKLTRAQS